MIKRFLEYQNTDIGAFNVIYWLIGIPVITVLVGIAIAL